MSSSYVAANISHILMEENEQSMHNGKQGTLKVERLEDYITKQEENPYKNNKDKVSSCIYIDKNHRITNSNEVTKITSLQ
jgi:hypothetical protein